MICSEPRRHSLAAILHATHTRAHIHTHPHTYTHTTCAHTHPQRHPQRQREILKMTVSVMIDAMGDVSFVSSPPPKTSSSLCLSLSAPMCLAQCSRRAGACKKQGQTRQRRLVLLSLFLLPNNCRHTRTLLSHFQSYNQTHTRMQRSHQPQLLRRARNMRENSAELDLSPRPHALPSPASRLAAGFGLTTFVLALVADVVLFGRGSTCPCTPAPAELNTHTAAHDQSLSRHAS